MNWKTLHGLALGLGVLLAGTAYAEETSTVLIGSRPDIAVQVGGGTNTFTTGLDKLTDTGAAWDVRGIYGVRQLVGAEVAYAGTVNQFSNTQGTGTYRILSNGGEALLRANFGFKNLGTELGSGFDLIPFVGVGGGFATMGPTDSSGGSVSQVAGHPFRSTTVFYIPAAAGVDGLIADRVLVGARVGYQYAFNNNMQTDQPSTESQSWAVTGRLGMAF